MNFDNVREQIDYETWEYLSSGSRNINFIYKKDDNNIVLMVYPKIVAIVYKNIEIWSHLFYFSNERISHIADRAEFINENIDASIVAEANGKAYCCYNCRICEETIIGSIYDHFEALHLPLTKSANKN